MSEIKSEDIISKDVLKNINKLNYEITKLDKKLDAFAKKYNVPNRLVIEKLKELID